MQSQLATLLHQVQQSITDESQYDDFLLEFVEIERLAKAMGLRKQFSKLMGEMYAAKGALAECESDLDEFAIVVKNYVN